MRQLLTPTSALTLALFLAPVSTEAGVQWTQTTRTIGGEVIVTNATEFALDIDNQTDTMMGLFLASTVVDTMVAGVSGVVTSHQDSDLFATGLSGSGGFQTTTAVSDPEGRVDAFGRSQFDGRFDLDAPTPYSITGQLTNGGLGTTSQIALIGPGGTIVDVLGSPGATVPVDASGTLAPGSYLVFLNMAGNAQEDPPSTPIEASGDWQMTFVLGGATDAPTLAPAAGLRVFPNPARGRVTISDLHTAAHLRIHDSAGRVVRAMDAVTAAVTWDTRDASGRPVPAGVYFVTVRRGGALVSEKVTVVR